MTKLEKEKLKLEIDHIFESGANEIRIFEMVVRFIDGVKVIENNEFLPEINSEYVRIKGESIIDDLKSGAWNIDHVSGYGSRGFIRATFIKTTIIILLNHIKRDGGGTTYKKRAKHILNECGFYHLSELARRMNINKQTLDLWVEKFDSVNVIELDGRNFYKFVNDENKCHKCGRIGGKHFAVCQIN